MNVLEIVAKEKKPFDEGKVFWCSGRRIYKADLNTRQYDYGYSVPYQLNMLVDGTIYNIKESSWSNLLLKVFNFLQSNKPIIKEDILSFELDWSKTELFTAFKDKANSKKTDFGVYMYCGFSSVHSCWVIKELLDFYDIRNASLFIFRSPFSEPFDVASYLTNCRKEEFRLFLFESMGFEESKANRVVNAIDSFNVLLTRLNYSYNNFYLIDDVNTYSNYKCKFLQGVQSTGWGEKEKEYASVYMSYFSKYHRYMRWMYSYTFSEDNIDNIAEPVLKNKKIRRTATNCDNHKEHVKNKYELSYRVFETVERKPKSAIKENNKIAIDILKIVLDINQPLTTSKIINILTGINSNNVLLDSHKCFGKYANKERTVIYATIHNLIKNDYLANNVDGIRNIYISNKGVEYLKNNKK